MGSDGMIVCSSWAGPPEPTAWDGHLLKKNKVGLGRMPGRTVVRQNPWGFAGLGGTSKFPQAESRSRSSARSRAPSCPS